MHADVGSGSFDAFCFDIGDLCFSLLSSMIVFNPVSKMIVVEVSIWTFLVSGKDVVSVVHTYLFESGFIAHHHSVLDVVKICLGFVVGLFPEFVISSLYFSFSSKVAIFPIFIDVADDFDVEEDVHACDVFKTSVSAINVDTYGTNVLECCQF